MTPDTFTAYMHQRELLVKRLIELSLHALWDGFPIAAKAISDEIVRIDNKINPR